MLDVVVITPTIKGREEYLQECIESVDSQIVEPKEHAIMVDERRRGPAFVRNKLVKSSNSEWIAFLDDDDLLYENHFEIHSRYMNGDNDVIFTWCHMLYEDGTRSPFRSKYDKKILEDKNTIPITATVRRSMFENAGGFNPKERWEDWDLWKRLSKKGAKFMCVEEFTWDYRATPESRNSKE